MEWNCEDHNFTLIFQSNSLPTGILESKVEISITTDEDYVLPAQSVPVSSFVSI